MKRTFVPLALAAIAIGSWTTTAIAQNPSRPNPGNTSPAGPPINPSAGGTGGLGNTGAGQGGDTARPGTTAAPAAAPGAIQDNRNAQGQSNSATQSSGDHQLAAWLLTDNHGEVALAKYASEHSKSDDVRKFAKQMIDDHGDFISKLEKFSGSSDARGSSDSRGSAPQATSSTKQPVNQVSASGASPQPLNAGHGVDFVQVKQELGKQCQESAMKELQHKEGSEFDKCYVGMQISMHMQMLDTLKVFKNHASPEMASVLDKGRDTTESHLEHAKKLMKELEGKTASK